MADQCPQQQERLSGLSAARIVCVCVLSVCVYYFIQHTPVLSVCVYCVCVCIESVCIEHTHTHTPVPPAAGAPQWSQRSPLQLQHVAHSCLQRGLVSAAVCRLVYICII